VVLIGFIIYLCVWAMLTVMFFGASMMFG